jgi:dihydroorotate dehydrogenase (NAD+) catalytic subunit
MDEDPGSMNRIIKSGVGAIVTKSIGLEPRLGYLNPTAIEVETGIINAMGLPNPGVKEFSEQISFLKKLDVPIIASIFGKNCNEFEKLATKMEKVDAFELNMSCPHASGYGLEIGCDPNLVKKIISDVKNACSVPIFVKLSPNLLNIVEIAITAEKAGADGIVAINTVKAMKIDINARIPVLSNKTGGYSGKAIKPIGIRCVYDIAKEVKIPIIGVGGITTGEDAIEYMMAGASAVQIGSAVFYRGVDVFKKVCNEIEKWMNNNGYKNINDLIGVAIK